MARIVLSAGCGDRPLGADYEADYVVGFDVAQHLLDANPSLDERICGDLQTYPLESGRYDVIVCQDVLEHLDRPLAAVDNMLRGLKAGGELRLGFPHPLTPKGLITKLTPHSFHQWAYRRLLRKPPGTAGGDGPYPTVMRWSLRPSAMSRYIRDHGLDVRSVSLGTNAPIERFWRRHPLLAAAQRFVWPFANPRLTECTIVARKPASQAPA